MSNPIQDNLRVALVDPTGDLRDPIDSVLKSDLLSPPVGEQLAVVSGSIVAGQEQWYQCIYEQTVSDGNVALAINTLWAAPFVSGRRGTVDRIGFRLTVNGGAGSRARIGLYNANQKTTIPTSLVVDGGEQITDAGAATNRSSVVSIDLPARTLFWAVYLCGVAAPSIEGQSTNGAGFYGRLSVLTTARSFLTSPFAYGALPSSFPLAGLALDSSGPAIFRRYSSIVA